jgi:hypothetical protein
MLFANIVGDVIWIVFCFAVVGVIMGLCALASWIKYMCAGAEGRAKIDEENRKLMLAERQRELNELNRQAEVKEEEIRNLGG